MPQQINVPSALSPKGGRLPLRLLLCMLLAAPHALSAQHLSSYAVAAGAALQDDARATAVFGASAGVRWVLPFVGILQRSVAELRADTARGTLRDISLAILPTWEPLGGRLALGAGAALHALRRDRIGAPDVERTRIAATAIAGLRLPLAGGGVMLELLGRADALEPAPQFSATMGVRIRPGVPNTLRLGEPASPARAAARAAVWNDVIMQLILLQQELESFSRIREIESGIELEFDQRSVTLYDDLARVARVLAAAEPPVLITVFAPNAGRAGAAVTAGSFPAERMRLQREERVYLRVEH